MKIIFKCIIFLFTIYSEYICSSTLRMQTHITVLRVQREWFFEGCIIHLQVIYFV